MSNGCLLCFFCFLVALGRPLFGAIPVAITVDDIPVHNLNGQEDPPTSNIKLIALFKEYRAPATVFVNGDRVKTPEDMEALKNWKLHDFEIGDHTFSHPNLNKMTAEEYEADIKKNESFLKDKLQIIPRFFRFTHLNEGETAEKRSYMQKALKKMGLTSVPITVDFGDWAWYRAYDRCLKINDLRTQRWIQRNMQLSASRNLARAERLARKINGKPIRHTLLLHVGSHSADLLKPILKDYQRRGVKFISTEEAMRDPFYRLDPSAPSDGGMTILDHWMQVSFPTTPNDPYEDIPFTKLSTLCSEGSTL